MRGLLAEVERKNCWQLAEIMKVMEVPKTFHVRLANGQTDQVVSEFMNSINPETWKRLALGLGEKGLNFYDWATLRVTPTTDEVGEQWLLIRRPLNNGDEPTYYLSNAPADTSLSTLAVVASSRWGVEQLLEAAKGEAGLDEFCIPISLLDDRIGQHK